MRKILAIGLILTAVVAFMILVNPLMTGFFYSLLGGLPGVALSTVAVATAIKVVGVGILLIAIVTVSVRTVGRE